MSIKHSPGCNCCSCEIYEMDFINDTFYPTYYCIKFKRVTTQTKTVTSEVIKTYVDGTLTNETTPVENETLDSPDVVETTVTNSSSHYGRFQHETNFEESSKDTSIEYTSGSSGSSNRIEVHSETTVSVKTKIEIEYKLTAEFDVSRVIAFSEQVDGDPKITIAQLVSNTSKHLPDELSNYGLSAFNYGGSVTALLLEKQTPNTFAEFDALVTVADTSLLMFVGNRTHDVKDYIPTQDTEKVSVLFYSTEDNKGGSIKELSLNFADGVVIDDRSYQYPLSVDVRHWYDHYTRDSTDVFTSIKPMASPSFLISLNSFLNSRLKEGQNSGSFKLEFIDSEDEVKFFLEIKLEITEKIVEGVTRYDHVFTHSSPAGTFTILEILNSYSVSSTFRSLTSLSLNHSVYEEWYFFVARKDQVRLPPTKLEVETMKSGMVYLTDVFDTESLRLRIDFSDVDTYGGYSSKPRIRFVSLYDERYPEVKPNCNTQKICDYFNPGENPRYVASVVDENGYQYHELAQVEHVTYDSCCSHNEGELSVGDIPETIPISYDRIITEYRSGYNVLYYKTIDEIYNTDVSYNGYNTSVKYTLCFNDLYNTPYLENEVLPILARHCSLFDNCKIKTNGLYSIVSEAGEGLIVKTSGLDVTYPFNTSNDFEVDCVAVGQYKIANLTQHPTALEITKIIKVLGDLSYWYRLGTSDYYSLDSFGTINGPFEAPGIELFFIKTYVSLRVEILGSIIGPKQLLEDPEFSSPIIDNERIGKIEGTPSIDLSTLIPTITSSTTISGGISSWTGLPNYSPLIFNYVKILDDSFVNLDNELPVIEFTSDDLQIGFQEYYDNDNNRSGYRASPSFFGLKNSQGFQWLGKKSIGTPYTWEGEGNNEYLESESSKTWVGFNPVDLAKTKIICTPRAVGDYNTSTFPN